MNLCSRCSVKRLLIQSKIILAESETIMDYVCDHFGPQLVPKRYPEGQEGVLGAETEEWMRHKVSCDGSILGQARGHELTMPVLDGLHRRQSSDASHCQPRHTGYQGSTRALLPEACHRQHC